MGSGWFGENRKFGLGEKGFWVEKRDLECGIWDLGKCKGGIKGDLCRKLGWICGPGRVRKLVLCLRVSFVGCVVVGGGLGKCWLGISLVFVRESWEMGGGIGKY